MVARSLVGSVTERTPTSTGLTAPDFVSSRKNGFPTVQHRSKSIFSRGRNEQRKHTTLRSSEVPPVQSTEDVTISDAGNGVADEASHLATPAGDEPESVNWRQQISAENERRVESMTEEELEEARREILDRFGLELLDRVSQARKRPAEPAPSVGRPEEGNQKHVPETPISVLSQALESATKAADTGHRHDPLHRNQRTPPPVLSASGTRPSSRADRRLRFADLTPNDIHVYESAPPSPRRKPLALPPPDPSDRSVISLGQASVKFVDNGQQRDDDAQATNEDQTARDPQTEEGTPEYIRRHYFPDAPPDDPAMEWMKSDSQPPPSTNSLRFDLTGKPIPSTLASTLPTYLGLHHHADSANAGYTLDDIFRLTRSTVPAQRATMLGVLAGIARRLAQARKAGDAIISELQSPEKDSRARILAAGIEAMKERGSVGARAVDVIFECIVRWDEDIMDVEGVELKDERREENRTADDVISSLPMEYILPQISSSFAQPILPTESLVQLLLILHRFAKHSNAIASAIVSCPNLIADAVQTFLLTPIPPTSASPLPNPIALRLLITLAQSSRANAATLLGPADALLRFVTMLPPNSPYSPSLAGQLLTDTLRLYASLASYGLYAHIATTAAAPFAALRTYLLSLKPGHDCQALSAAWAGLLESWIVCATDPHRTTPSHDVLWSQVVGMGWNEDVLAVRDTLTVGNEDWEVWEMAWRAEAAWLEGARVNCVKGGQEERRVVVEALRGGFETGKEKEVVVSALEGLRCNLEECWPAEDSEMHCLQRLASNAKTLAASIRLWLACMPPLSDEPLLSPPFLLPFAQISNVSAKLVTHPLWSAVLSGDVESYVYASVRSLTALLSVYFGLSKRLPDIPEDIWMAQAFSILYRLIPGDEESALHILKVVLGLINPHAMAARDWHVPSVIWDKGGMDAIEPFLKHAIRPTETIYISPMWISPQSILLSTTQRLPSRISCYHGVEEEFGLPLARDWTFSTVDFLLRSGISSVFHSFPSSWDASETEVVRASFLLTKVSQTVLRLFSMHQLVLTREEVVFGCMKVFMLENGHEQIDSSDDVFRDNLVEQLMKDILALYTVSAAAGTQSSGRVELSPATQNLENVASRFLGSTTPFYQFYTDFLALYDAVSFAHPLFVSLLLPPTALRYPIDYRKHLWNDFGHVLRTIRLTFDQVIANDIAEYLWPIDDDPQMIGAYLRALLQEPLGEFLRLVAVHHVACNIWPELGGVEVSGKEGPQKLLKAVVMQGNVEVVRDIVTYRQTRHSPISLPPKCFGECGQWREERMQWIASLRDSVLVERLGNLLRV